MLQVLTTYDSTQRGWDEGEKRNKGEEWDKGVKRQRGRRGMNVTKGEKWEYWDKEGDEGGDLDKE